MSDILIGNYSPESVMIVISKGDFVHQITGFAEGTFITASRLVPASEPYIGSDISGGRVKRRNRSANVTITLHQYSQSNDVLQALQRADEAADDNTYVFNCLITDNSGHTKLFSSQTIIATTPDVSLSSTTETRDWTFFMFNSDTLIGGNTPISAASVQAIESIGGVVEDRWKA